MKKQPYLFAKESSTHGGSLKNACKRQRPLSTKQSMHLVLRSKQATHKWSLRLYRKDIDIILRRFAYKYRVQILSYANVGNHLHLHIRLHNRRNYRAFIRAISAAIMMKVTGFCQWRPKPEGFRFWEHRPFSRIVSGYRAFIRMVDYIQINYLEGLGCQRQWAIQEVKRARLIRQRAAPT
jgi:putative transposase